MSRFPDFMKSVINPLTPFPVKQGWSAAAPPAFICVDGAKCLRAWLLNVEAFGSFTDFMKSVKLLSPLARQMFFTPTPVGMTEMHHNTPSLLLLVSQ